MVRYPLQSLYSDLGEITDAKTLATLLLVRKSSADYRD